MELVLDSPKAGNSFGLDQACRVKDEINNINKHDLLVFRSGGGANFCAGGDLSFYANKSKEEGLRANQIIYESLQQIKSSRPVSLCVVEGNCFGGGMELISCFDFIISTPQSYFGFWQRKIALSFGWGGRTRWQDRLNPAQIRSLSLEAKSISAYKAQQMNIVDGVVPRHKLEDYILDWLSKQRSLPQAPIENIKSAAEGERAGFNNIWFNKEHQQILKDYKSSKPSR